MQLSRRKIAIIAILVAVIVSIPITFYYFTTDFNRVPISVTNGNSSGVFYSGNLTKNSYTNGSRLYMNANSTISEEKYNKSNFDSQMAYYGFYQPPGLFGVYAIVVFFSFNGSFVFNLHPSKIIVTATVLGDGTVDDNVSVSSIDYMSVGYSQTYKNNITGEDVGRSRQGSLSFAFTPINQEQSESSGMYLFGFGNSSFGNGYWLTLTYVQPTWVHNLTFQLNLTVQGLSQPVTDSFSVYLIDTSIADNNFVALRT